MDRRRLLALVASLAFPWTAAAQPASPQPQQPMFSEADAAAAKATIDRYFAAFSVRDYPAFRQVFTVPYLMGGRALETLPTLDAVMQRYLAVRERLDKADYASSKAAEVRLTPLGDVSALANVHWQRFKKDGSLLNEGAEILLLAKVDGAWKLTGVLPEDLRAFAAAR